MMVPRLTRAGCSIAETGFEVISMSTGLSGFSADLPPLCAAVSDTISFE